MTNYNDGKWHGWNGGGCPVHPKTVVEFMMGNGTKGRLLALEHEWSRGADHENPCIAFRVVKEHREPREFWLWNNIVFPSLDMATYGSRGNVDHRHKGKPIIHVREVLPD